MLLILTNLPSTVIAQSAPPKVTIPIPTPITPPPSQPVTPSPSPTPILPPPVIKKPSNHVFRQEERIFIKKINLEGDTVLKNQIHKLVQKFENKLVTFEQLLQLRSEITQLYINNGYFSSGAFIPNNQDISSGIVNIQIVEGKLEKIHLIGLRSLQPGYVRSRLQRFAGTPLNQKRLESGLQLLRNDPLINKVNAELIPGSAPGLSILEVKLQEAPAFHAGIFTDNYQSPSIGSDEVGAFIEHDNLLGFGDRLNAEYSLTQGLNLYDINYTIPIDSLDGTVGFDYSNNDSNIIETPFESLNIKSGIKTYSLNIRQPLYKSPKGEFALGLALDVRRNQTFLLNNIPFSFSQGANNGKSNVTVIRFSQDWVSRGTNRVLAARSQFSLGIDAFDTTINNTGTDGRFFDWLGQFQWVQRLSPKSIFVARFGAQLTGDSLLSVEQFSLGGVDTVRGYRQNQLLTDNGVLGSLEVRFPVFSNYNKLQLAPFFDFGAGWNNRGSNPNPNTIASLGLGLIWQPSNELNLRLDYGIPLMDVNNSSNSLQDQGLYFSLRYQPF